MTKLKDACEVCGANDWDDSHTEDDCLIAVCTFCGNVREV